MKRFSTAEALWMSFYSKDLYRDVAANWGRTAFLYLFLLTAVTLIPTIYRMQEHMTSFISQKAPGIINQIPVITIAKGMATADAPMPFTVKDPETGEPFLVIDTSGTVNSLEGSKALFLVTRQSLKMKRPGMSWELDEFGDVVVDHRKLYDWLETTSEMFVPLLYPLLLALVFAMRVGESLVFAVAGLLFGRRLGVPLRYSTQVRLSATAMTPAVIFNTFYEYSGIFLTFWWVFSVCLSLGYLFFAVKANGEQVP